MNCDVRSAENPDAGCGLSAAGIGGEVKEAERPGRGSMRPLKTRACASTRDGNVAQPGRCRVESGSAARDARKQGAPLCAETVQRGVKTNQENTMKKKNVGSAAIRASREDIDKDWGRYGGQDDVVGAQEVGLDEYYQDEVLVDWDALEEVRALFADRYDGEPEV